MTCVSLKAKSLIFWFHERDVGVSEMNYCTVDLQTEAEAFSDVKRGFLFR